MKFRFAPPPVQDLEIGNAQPVRYPSLLAFSVGGVAVGLLLLGVIAGLMAMAGLLPLVLGELKKALDTQPPLVFLGSLFGVLLVHEAVHCLGFPGFLRSERTLLGVLPKTGLAYAWCGHPMRRSRYLSAALAPLVLLSVIPLLLFAAIPSAVGPLLPAVLFNVVGAGADAMVAVLLMLRVPHGSWIQLSGSGAYWGTAPQCVDDATSVAPVAK